MVVMVVMVIMFIMVIIVMMGAAARDGSQLSGREGKENLRAEVIDILDDIGGRGPKYVAGQGYNGRPGEPSRILARASVSSTSPRPGKSIPSGQKARVRP